MQQKAELVKLLSKRYGFNEEEGMVVAGVKKIDLPFSGCCNEENCRNLVKRGGLYLQCEKKKDECKTCKKEYGTIEDRLAVSKMDYVSPKGDKVKYYSEIMRLNNWSKELVLLQAEILGRTLSPDDFITVDTQTKTKTKNIKKNIEDKQPQPTNTKKVIPDTIEEPIPDTIEELIPDTIEDPIPDTIEEPIPDKIEELIPDQIEELIPDQIEEPIPDTIEEPIPDKIEELIPDHIEEPIEDTIEEPIPDTIEETIPDTIEETIEEPIKKTKKVKKVVEKPLEEPSKKTKKVKKAVQEPILESIEIKETAEVIIEKEPTKSKKVRAPRKAIEENANKVRAPRKSKQEVLDVVTEDLLGSLLDMSKEEEEEEYELDGEILEIEVKKIEYKGVTMLRAIKTGIIYSLETQEEIGMWDDEKNEVVGL